jgi:hypothetical protein
MTTQADNLERVSHKIADAVLFWCQWRLATSNPDFRMADLQAYVCEQIAGVSPDSPSRILRMLRRSGRINYVVVSRSQSLYRLTPGQGSLFR